MHDVPAPKATEGDDEPVDRLVGDSEMERWLPNWLADHKDTLLNFGRVVATAQRQQDAVRSKHLQRLLARSRGETAETEHRLEDAVVRSNTAEEAVKNLKDMRPSHRKLLERLAAVADAYDEDGLDEVRPSRGVGGDHDRETVLLSGRGGRPLLKLADFLEAKVILRLVTSHGEWQTTG